MKALGDHLLSAPQVFSQWEKTEIRDYQIVVELRAHHVDCPQRKTRSQSQSVPQLGLPSALPGMVSTTDSEPQAMSFPEKPHPVKN